MRLDDLKRQIELATTGALMVRAQGGDAEIPDPDALVAEFNTALAEPPQRLTQADIDQQVLLVALGLK